MRGGICWPTRRSSPVGEIDKDEEANTFSFDIKGNKVTVELVGREKRALLPGLASNWTELQLVRWLDKQIHQDDLAQPVLLEFIRRCIASLTRSGFDLVALSRAKYTLAPAIAQKVNRYREQESRKGFQLLMTDKKGIVETSFEYAFKFDPAVYPAKSYYRGGYDLKKHYYPHIGDLAATGEEFRCAQALASLPQVKHWVRNIAREERFSFWLPTSTDKFYPDLVAELTDGRILVVEYKGEHLKGDDAKEKENIGQLWEESSKGKGLFLMAWDKDVQGRDVTGQLRAKLAG
jgi:type III restriction enzyme